MLYSFAASAVLIVHGVFILFVLLGGLLVWRWPKLAWLHLAAVVWGITVEWTGWICPLTPLENQLREAAGMAGYQGGFIEHYLLPLIYPTWLTRDIQFWLGGLVLTLNGLVYAGLLWRWRRRAVKH